MNWKVLHYHNLGRWRGNLWSVANSILAQSVMFFTLQMFLGIAHFYAVVNNALAHAKIISFTTDGNYILDPGNNTWSLWNPGQKLVITSQDRSLMGSIQTLITVTLTSISGLFFVSQTVASRQQSKLELESREADYRAVLSCTLNRQFLVHLVVAQKLLLILPAVLLALATSNYLLVPITVRMIDRALPGIDPFFTLSLSDLLVLAMPLFILTLLGLLFAFFYSRKLLRRLV